MVELTPVAMAVRLLLSFLAGSIIGFERSSRHQVAGLRTHVLICLGSSLLMLLSIWLPQQYLGGAGDPGRIAAQVVSGIGFLGAGAIVKLGNNVKGLTTAASLWLVSAIGLTIGAGLYWASGIAFGFSILTLVVLERVELRFFPQERNKLLELGFHETAVDANQVVEILERFDIRVQSTDVEQSLEKGGTTRLRLLVGLPTATDLQRLGETLRREVGASHVEVKEKY